MADAGYPESDDKVTIRAREYYDMIAELARREVLIEMLQHEGEAEKRVRGFDGP